MKIANVLNLFILIIITTLVSCNTNTSNSKSKPKQNRLDLQRQVFADLVLSPMQKEIQKTMDQYVETSLYLQAVEDYQDKDQLELQTLNADFLKSNSKQIERFSDKKTRYLARRWDLKNNLIIAKKILTKKKETFDQKNSAFKACSAKLDRDSKRLASRASDINQFISAKKDSLDQKAKELQDLANQMSREHEIEYGFETMGGASKQIQIGNHLLNK